MPATGPSDEDGGRRASDGGGNSVTENRALSQWEIDALLNQIPDGGSEPVVGPAQPVPGGLAQASDSFTRAVKSYDFRRPDKFSKEQWGTLQSMHDTFARLVGSSFSSRLRTLVTVRLSSLDQGLYAEWQSQVPSQTVCYVLAMRPLDGNIVVEFNNDVAADAVDRLLGGTGLLIDRTRGISEMELTLLRAFAVSVIGPLRDMWQAAVPAQPELVDMGQDASLIQVAGPNDAVLTAFFEINIGNQLGAMSMCVPYALIEPIVPKLSAQVWFAAGKQGAASARDRRRVQRLIGDAPLELRALLGRAEVPVGELVEMEEGDTIVLESRVGVPLDVEIGGYARFTGVPGTEGTRTVLQLREVIDPPAADSDEESEDEDAAELGADLTGLDATGLTPPTTGAAPVLTAIAGGMAPAQEGANG